MFSLPTILDKQAPPIEQIRRVASPLTIDDPLPKSRNHLNQDVEKQMHLEPAGEIAERPKPDRRNWISWSVGAIPSSSSSQMRNRQSLSQRRSHQRYSYHEDCDRDRRPSDPNSICPLLAPSPQDSSSITFTHPSSSFLPDDTILPSPPPSSVTVQRNSSILTPTSSQPLRASSDMTSKYPQQDPMFDPIPFGGSYNPSSSDQNQRLSPPRRPDNPTRDGTTSPRSDGEDEMSFMDMLDAGPDLTRKRRRFSKDV